MCAIESLIRNALDSLAPKTDLYAGSIWEPVLKESSRRKGKFGESFTHFVFDEMLKHEVPGCFDLVRSTKNPESDVDIWGTFVEVKTSMLWHTNTKTNHFKFQQIRDQEYSYVFFLGYLPDGNIMCWLIPKKVIRANSTGQHGGKDGNVLWSQNICPDNIPSWMNQYGGLWKAPSLRIPQKSLRKKLLMPFEDKIRKSKLNQIDNSTFRKKRISRKDLYKLHNRSRTA